MYVYFIRAGKKGAIKIGIAKDVGKRIAELQVGNAFLLNVLASIPCETRKQAEWIEKRMHKIFARRKIRGEWFEGTIEFKPAVDRIHQELTAMKFR